MPTGVYTRTEVHRENSRRNIKIAQLAINYSAPRKPLSKEHKEKLSKVKKGRKLSEEHKKKLSEAARRKWENPEMRRKWSEMFKGDKSYFWRGGVSTENQILKSSLEYNEWRRAVLKRDRYTCVFCGDRNHKGRGSRIVLNVDHIQPFALYPELRFDVNNGRVLCIDCHRKTDTYGFRINKLIVKGK
jgi:hypothetical protein